MNSTIVLVKPKRFGDDRGWFSEVYNEKKFESFGISCRFVQDNHSLSVRIGTLRGLHFQTPPFGQDKLVRCVRGRIFDVAVDIRKGSPTFGQWIGAELSADNGHELFIPVGYAHGFFTMEPDTEVTYKVSNFYAPDCDAGLAWNDPEIGIAWPLPADAAPLLSDKDGRLPRLAGFESPFAGDGRPMQMIEV
ncbi:dTDP-4-dehydrorhamnose 3,5-epimerase [Kaistia soli DSM 19436]|uniref:dTDP-4-dehydrorhamnose 3,5-epimerase n=1 Tax=Kaistia soli DSM 19436 TaxID=1122133 RepID=A0A1M4ZZS9_9HYPH|nr:dTDP-4-dehydrorhamnose 3,5-epimerase [Kaistia soli]SHF23508.1 dTDP-4-dehydrorhamnose 3,5-epimerase [Kaistia soli DSM 19436]